MTPEEQAKSDAEAQQAAGTATATATLPDPALMSDADKARAAQAKADEAKAAAERTAAATGLDHEKLGAAIAKGVAEGMKAQGQAPAKDRAMGRSNFTTEQLLVAKHSANQDGTALSPQQLLSIDTEMELRHREDLYAASQVAKQQVTGLSGVTGQYPEMADMTSPLYQEVAKTIRGNPMDLAPEALMIATKAAAHDLDIKPVSKRGQKEAQVRQDTLTQIQAAQAAAAMPKGAGGAGVSVAPQKPYGDMTTQELEAEISRVKGF